ncbi:hypothetical protein H257_11646 [Aphanomyces astaci]|uniref:Retrotransposon gag domain-containing protein n=1 Tax=Aphanomyces astaci TaxID=112090 RepID=W4G1D6_APHAT|nr:hypothetical protein H257_11646 [Aphanomyces astaci]ETV73522.1 hypothetical protein H257_11646 [Aphanomyces astaci]|eukprot:XP_009836948.1 hypothetical protein H257_11646 [Aphanomyces astaci]
MSPEVQARLVEGIGSTIKLSVAESTVASTTAHATLEEQMAQMTSYGRNLEDYPLVARETMATLEEQASAMLTHDRTLQWIPSDSPKIRMRTWRALKNAQRISDQATCVAFAISHLKERAEDWVISKRLMDPLCFPSFATFEVELKAMLLPLNSDFRYRSQYLACKQGKRFLQEFIHDLRFLAAIVIDEESLPEPLRVAIVMVDLNQGPASTQLFRAYPRTFEEAVRIALSESFSFAHARADLSGAGTRWPSFQQQNVWAQATEQREPLAVKRSVRWDDESVAELFRLRYKSHLTTRFDSKNNAVKKIVYVMLASEISVAMEWDLSAAQVQDKFGKLKTSWLLTKPSNPSETSSDTDYDSDKPPGRRKKRAKVSKASTHGEALEVGFLAIKEGLMHMGT